MRKLIYIYIAAFSLVFSSCSDFLETSSDSKMTDETIYTSVYYTESAVKGIYDRIADAQMYAQRLSINWSTNNDIEFVGADESSYNQNTNRGASNYYATSGNATLIWTRIYQMIERSNLVIQGIENSPLMLGTDKDQAAMKTLLGEAKTLRAMGYYELVKHWGDVPFKTEPTKNDLSNVYLPKTDRDSICEYLITELLSIEKDVPWVGESAGSVSYSTAERISKGFVKGLIARIALTRGGYSLRDKPGYPTERRSDYLEYYKIARTQCLEIMNVGKYRLKSSYVDIWKDVCALKADGLNGENLYEVALGLSQSGEIGYSIGVRFYTNTKYGYGNNSNVVNTSAYYYYSFEPEDPRRDATITTIAYSNASGDQKEVFQSNPLSYNFAKWDQRWMAENTKWLDQNKEANGKWGYGVNWINMRYADVLLMFAETENELNGPTDAAKNALKEVRARAFAGTKNESKNVADYVSNLSSKEQFFNALINERAWEFGGEAIRKFDLIRWNLLEKKILEQRKAFQDMISGAAVEVFDKKYSSLPQNLFYKYKADKENIDKDSTSYYVVNAELEALDDNQLKARGYTKVKWMSGFSEENKRIYNERIQLFSSGLFKDYNGVCVNRYLYPIHSSVIGDYQGIVTNSYGY
ncbi:putative outer membrane starch-binding protein [Dysgonomonas alginatilytica]|uniref:Putative outer membrane starch-binding protein n=1 Tax=Dysgonomonas alginatilytica TaxID=1605892 RepID=A0A2V3PQP5_9BACT|nr:RagB/SusD family nutrient uptake outer membrane protein [Dysgonomonas alginatilytica]PXV63600.1 putative outer membrane starch-binding protein [Dysgonomonas alginatilytica]